MKQHVLPLAPSHHHQHLRRPLPPISRRPLDAQIDAREHDYTTIGMGEEGEASRTLGYTRVDNNRSSNGSNRRSTARLGGRGVGGGGSIGPSCRQAALLQVLGGDKIILCFFYPLVPAITHDVQGGTQ